MEYVRTVDFDTLLGTDARMSQALVDAGTGATNCAVSCVKTPAGQGSPEGLHTHRVDQLFYVLQGTMMVAIEEKVHSAGPGTLVIFPAGVPHRNWNNGPDATVHLSIVAPVPEEGVPFATRVPTA
jgi:quercetin dioxygenase-like cupin family protein